MNTMKSILGKVLAERLKDGEVIGVGSGSTVEAAVHEIGARVQTDDLKVFAVTTSYRSALVAREAGLRVLEAVSAPAITWAFDGADEVDGKLNMIKGRGAAMLSEKIVAKRAGHFVVIISEEKLVKKLGEKFAVPVEVVPEALSLVEHKLFSLGAKEVQLRKSSEKYGPLITEHNNFVLDARFEIIPPELEVKIKSIPGVVESGLFIGFDPEVLIQRKDEVWVRKRRGAEIIEEKISSR